MQANPKAQGAETGKICEFKVSLIDIVSFRTPRLCRETLSLPNPQNNHLTIKKTEQRS